MILSKTVKIKNTKYYKNLGYQSDIDGNSKIRIEDLKKGSNLIILAKCDFCEIKKEISYNYYNNNHKNGNKFSCSKKCGVNKTKITNIEKYGVDSFTKTDEYSEKTKQTNLEKYGVEFVIHNDIIRNKIKQTNLEKYGTEFVFKNKLVKDKIKQTNLKKYGTEFPLQNKEIHDKFIKTNLEKYGVEYYTQTYEYLLKNKQTNLEKYGIDSFTKTDEYSEKTKLTNLKKYGVNSFRKSEESKINTIIANHPNYIKYIDNSISLFNCDLNKNHEFEIHSDNFFSRLYKNIPICTICYPIGDNKSIKEKILLEYIQSIYSGEVISGYRDALEIDIYLPELKIGIEFNGLYWHSNKFKEPNYHINKLNYFKSKDIDIKFIYEDDFDNNLTIIKSQISNWLSLTKTKIHARKCEVKQIVYIEEYKDFLNNNHIQGFVASKLIYGLYYKDQLVSLMCFDKKEGRLNMSDKEWNLNRFCNLLNHQVIGGASKLLNHFIKENNPKRVISYADKDWSNGNLYFTLGFNLLSESKPDYKYIVDGIRKSKQNFTKDKLGKMGHDISLTESQIMNNLGINKIYDCGKMKFELLINKEVNI